MINRLEEIENDLLQKIYWAQNRRERIAVCADAFQMISEQDSKQKLELFQWYLENADEKWFCVSQERNDRANREERLREVFTEDETAQLLELLQKTLPTDHDDSYVASIPAATKVISSDINQGYAKYQRSILGFIDLYSNEGYSVERYYRLLWDSTYKLLASASVSEKGVGLYIIVSNRRTPYYEVAQGTAMEVDEFQSICNSIKDKIRKMEFILSLRSTNRMKTASQLYTVLEEIEGPVQRTAFLCRLMMLVESEEDE